MPFTGTVLHATHADCDRITFSNSELASLDFLAHANGRGIKDRWHHAQRFIEAHRVELKVRVVFKVDQLENVKVFHTLVSLKLSSFDTLLQIRLHDLFFKLRQDLVLVLGMLA